MIPITRKTWIVGIAAAAALALGGFYLWVWNLSRIWIGPDEIGVVVAHVGEELPPGRALAGPGQKGVREQVLGPGRHFIHPFTETVQRFPILHVESGRDSTIEDGKVIAGKLPEVGIVTSLVGRTLPEGDFLANPGEKGVLRKVLVPGKYALNPYAFTVEKVPATVIDSGYVGVITHLTGDRAATELVKPNERGVLENPLPAGVYWLNTREFMVTPVKVGYQEIAFEGGESISFPSADGDTIKVDATVVWGIQPGDAPHVVKQFGSEKAVVENAIKPQAESKARVAGSNYTSRQFVEGDSRERFQDEFFKALKDELETKRVRVLLALVRNIEVPNAVRKPIQISKISVEEEITNREKTETAKVLTELSTIRGNVEIESSRARADTEKLALEESTRGQAEVARVEAETKTKIAEAQAEAARVKGEAKRLLGKADADVATLAGRNQADALHLRYAPFGDASAYGLWRFAEGLSDGLKIELRDGAAGGLDGAEWLKALQLLAAPSGAANPKK